MKAPTRNRFIVPATSLDTPTREGEVLEVGGFGGQPPYLVMWAGGLLHPAPASVTRVDAERWYAAGAPGDVPLHDVADPAASTQAPRPPADSPAPQVVDELALLRARRQRRPAIENARARFAAVAVRHP